MSKAANVTPEQVARMIDLQRKSWTHWRIADELGLARETVSRALGQVNRKIARRLERRLAEERVRQVEQLDEVADEVMQEWRADRGNAPILAQWRGTLADKRTILGLDAPTKIAPTDPAGNSIIPGFLEALAKAYGDRGNAPDAGPLPPGGP